MVPANRRLSLKMINPAQIVFPNQNKLLNVQASLVPTPMKTVQLLFLALSTFTFTGCAGYHPGASKPHQLAAVKKLAIPAFKNDTLEPRIEALLTDAVIKKLQNDGGYKIVSVSEADAVLKGTITDVTRRQFRAQRENTLVTSEILVGLVVKFTIEAINPEIIAANKVAKPTEEGVEEKTSNTIFTGQTRSNSNIVVNANYQLSVRQALADSAERLSNDLVGQITVGW